MNKLSNGTVSSAIKQGIPTGVKFALSENIKENHSAVFLSYGATTGKTNIDNLYPFRALFLSLFLSTFVWEWEARGRNTKIIEPIPGKEQGN